jgi:hypothetical protein
LLLVPAIANTRTKIIEPLPLNDIIEHALVLFPAMSVAPARDPAHVAQAERARLNSHIFGGKCLGNLVAVVPRLDLARVEDQDHVVGPVREGDGVCGVEGRRGALLAWEGEGAREARGGADWCGLGNVGEGRA